MILALASQVFNPGDQSGLFMGDSWGLGRTGILPVFFKYRLETYATGFVDHPG